tara:strand:+ start:1590 stop:2663 length:1074 start_codon:yes stop_codon:yes gene_type:complete
MWFEILKDEEEPPDEALLPSASSMIMLLPSKEQVTISEAYSLYDAPTLPTAYYKYVAKPVGSDLGVAYHTEFKRWITQHNPNHRGMYDFLDQSIRNNDKAHWIYKPVQEGGDKWGSQHNNYKGLFWVASNELEDSWLFNLNYRAAVHADMNGVCVYKRGKMLSFDQYKFSELETKEPDNPENRPTGLLSQSLVTDNVKIHVDKKGSEEIETKKAKMVYDFLSSMEITNEGPKYGDVGPLPRWVKVSLGLGESTPRSICILLGRGHSEKPRGDKMNTGLMGYSQNLQTWKNQIEAAIPSMQGKRPGANTYPLESTMVKLNKEFPTWKGDNDEENKKVLDYLEDQNYYLTITNLERLME